MLILLGEQVVTGVGWTNPWTRGDPRAASRLARTQLKKSKGLFSADDWQCSKCGNVNWARRSTCNVCNGPQFTVEEERTGLGGGFDERRTVEYKTPPRVESDDEFDDLGRRKLKRKLPYKKPMIAQSVPDPPSEPEEEEEEEEEEEDDDDDGDLSKYDLWGDPDKDMKDAKEDSKPSNGSKAKEESSKVSESKTSRSKSKKRSRSRSKDTSKKRSRRSR